MINMTQAKLFRRPDILIMSLYLNFSTKISSFSFFGHPVWLKYSFTSLVYPYSKTSSQNVQHHKGKTFQEIQYFDHTHISQFFRKIKSIFIFWTHYISKIAFYYRVSQKKLTFCICSISKEPRFRFLNHFFLLKTDIHILNMEPFLCDIRGLRYIQNKIWF